MLCFKTDIDWHEDRKMLKVEFPVDVLASEATYSTQFGSLKRPTHKNTSWDIAKFEVPGHHYVDLSEFGFGVSLLSDCKYGYACLKNVIRMSLLRSTKMPDAHADMGKHSFAYAIYPHAGTPVEANVVQLGYQFNSPLVPLPQQPRDSSLPELLRSSLLNVLPTNLIIEVVKKAQHTSSIVIRGWETAGGRGKGKISLGGHLAQRVIGVKRVNLLENSVDTTGAEDVPSLAADSSSFRFVYTPFQIFTFLLELK